MSVDHMKSNVLNLFIAFSLGIGLIFLQRYRAAFQTTPYGVQHDGILNAGLGNDSLFKTTADSPMIVNGNFDLGFIATSGNGSILNPYLIGNKSIGSCTSGIDGVSIQNTD